LDTEKWSENPPIEEEFIMGDPRARSSTETTHPPFPGRLITQPPPMKGEDVKTWQNRMHQRGWKIKVDSIYGPKSENVCRAFQAEKKLKVDGIVGPKTWDAAWTAPIT
jgi:peptidoglycan hydrolase-like protein with peptidoglycan-binding domain